MTRPAGARCGTITNADIGSSTEKAAEVAWHCVLVMRDQDAAFRSGDEHFRSGRPSSLAARALWKSMEGSRRSTPARTALRRSLSARNRGFI